MARFVGVEKDKRLVVYRLFTSAIQECICTIQIDDS